MFITFSRKGTGGPFKTCLNTTRKIVNIDESVGLDQTILGKRFIQKYLAQSEELKIKIALCLMSWNKMFLAEAKVFISP